VLKHFAISSLSCYFGAMLFHNCLHCLHFDICLCLVICMGNPQVNFIMPGPELSNYLCPFWGYKYTHGLPKINPRVNPYPYPYVVLRFTGFHQTLKTAICRYREATPACSCTRKGDTGGDRCEKMGWGP
jgi:hypothetical protein